MAVYNVSNDNSGVRMDAGLFGGLALRPDTNRNVIFKYSTSAIEGKTGNLIQTNVGNDGKLGLDGYDYRIVYVGEIQPKQGWTSSNTFYTTGESAVSDYKLDWDRASFTSLIYQVPNTKNFFNQQGDPITPAPVFNPENPESWITTKVISTTSDSTNLPYRAANYDSMRVSDFSMGDQNNDRYPGVNENELPSAQRKTQYDKAFEYQSVLFNIQYPFGSSTAQYLFGDDNITGSRIDDVLRGYAGNDKISGANGDDLLFADYGQDQLFGGPGDDVLVFGGSSSSWDVENYKYRDSPVELAVGGAGKDYFVFRTSDITFVGRSDVIYDANLPDLYSGKYTYKVVRSYELNSDPINAYFRVNSTGSIVTVDAAGKETEIKKAAFANNPYQKFQNIEVWEEGGVLKTADKNGATVNILSPNTMTDWGGYDFFVDSANAVFKVPKSQPNSTPVSVKTSVYTATNTPFLKTQGLNVEVTEAGDIVATGIWLGSANWSDEYQYMANLNTFQQSVYVKSGALIVKTEPVDDYSGAQRTPIVSADENGDFYVRSQTENWNYNPYLSQSQNSDYVTGLTGADRATKDRANGRSDLTQVVKIQDFSKGRDKIDLSAFGLDQALLTANAKALDGKFGTTYLTELSKLLKPEGLKITSAKNGWTSGNTSLFLKEDAADVNGNDTKDDTILEIQLVGINISSIDGRFFGEANLISDDAF